MPLGADVVDRDGDLAVGLLAQLAAVLMLHADGVLALLGEAGIVDDEDPPGAGQGSGHHGAIALQTGCSSQGLWLTNCCRACSGSLMSRSSAAWGRGRPSVRCSCVRHPGAGRGGRRRSRRIAWVAEEVLEPLGIVAKPKEDFGGEFWGVGLVHTDHTNKAPGRFVDLNGVVLRIGPP